MNHQLNRRRILGMGLSIPGAVITYRFGAAQESDAESKAQEFVTPADVGPKEAYTFLVLGMDTRPDESELQTDVIKIARVDLAANTVRIVSIPRDLYVEIPGVGWDKINAAFQWFAANGNQDWMKGIAATRATVQQNFGVQIDGVLTLRFEGAEALVDLVGGVTVDNPYEVDDGSWHFPAGELHLNGKDALGFMRTRYDDSDDGRVMRQDLVIEALLRHVQSISDPTALASLIEIGRKYVTTDIPADVQLQLIAAAPNIPLENVVTGYISPMLSSGFLPNGQWVYQGDWDTLPGYVQSFLAGEVD